MLLERLIQALPTRFPDVAWRRSEDNDAEIVFPAVSPEFGDIVVSEHPYDGELIAMFGHFTHAHFGCYDGDLQGPERAEAIVADLMDCLAEVFADRLEFYGSHAGIGGFRKRGTQGALSLLLLGREAFVWSGRPA